MARLLALLCFALLPACETIQVKEFKIVSIDTSGSHVRSLVVVNGDREAALREKYHSNSNQALKVSFDGSKSTKIELYWIGEKDGVPNFDAAVSMKFVRGERHLYFDDASLQLLVLVANPDYDPDS